MTRRRETRTYIRVLVARRAHLARLTTLSSTELDEYRALTWALRRFRDVYGDVGGLRGIDLTFRCRRRPEGGAGRLRAALARLRLWRLPGGVQEPARAKLVRGLDGKETAECSHLTIEASKTCATT